LPRETTYIDAATGKTDTRKLVVSFKMFTVDEVAEHVYNHYSAIDLEEGEDSNFAELYPLDRLRETILNSLRRVGETKDIVSAGNRQRILASFGTMQRGSAKRVRYRMIPDALVRINTAERPRDSVGIGALSTTTLLVPRGYASDLEAGLRSLSLAARLPLCLTVAAGDSSEVTL